MGFFNIAYGCTTGLLTDFLPINILCTATPFLFHQPTQQHRYQRLLDQSQDSNRILLTALIMAILFSAIVVYLLREQHKKEKLLAAYITEKRIARKLHDEIANELYGTILMVSNSTVIAGKGKEQLLEQLDSIYKSTRDISRQNIEIDTGLHYPVQLRLLLKMYSSETVRINVKGFDDIPWDKLSEIQKITTFRILQEMMVNMKKHSNATLVFIDLKNTPGIITISYSDNGIGIDCKSDIHINYIQGIKNRLATIDGDITIDKNRNKGFHISFSFKK
ncbi:sensor histidine kinase [Flavobacterium psychrotrophum]|uniref:sensor histidine kinase n=1 Tax=Flavobacterium psychrotrophum TaxID=2294119 RepID=UPI000E314EEC|nr:histidine kinase [Flavobacterium psychrotrophum]